MSRRLRGSAMARRSLRAAIALATAIASGCTAIAPATDGPASPTTSPAAVVGITAGGYHTCALDADGGVSCWGLGDYEQLGTGSAETSAVPTTVIAPDGVAFSDVVAGNAHTCAIDREGAVWCWGVDLDGGDEADLNATHGPERVAFPDGVRLTAIDGTYHSCAIDEDGNAWCWGRGTEGQLGDGSSTDAPSPVEVARPDGVRFVTIAAGAFHSCALDDAGSVWCWGQDLRDQLDGADAADTSVPHRVTLPDGAVAIALTAGFNHTCALAEDGAAWCWGEGTDGQLGDGTGATGSVEPVAVQLPEGVRVTEIDAGNAHTCAITMDGSVWCWGLGIQGGAIDGASTDHPILVIEDGDATAISAGGFHSCALLADGTTWCWGDDSVGQLGDGTIGGTSAPVAVRSRA